MPIIRRPHRTTINTGEMVWGPLAGAFPSVGNPSVHVMNDADNSCGMTGIVPRTGTLTHIGVYVSARTGTPPAYTVGLSVPTGRGYPSTTAYGGSAFTDYTFETTGWHWIELSTPASATAGDLVAAVIKPSASAPDASNTVTVWRAISAYPIFGQPTSTYYSIGWAQSGAFPGIGIKYSDGSLWRPGVSGYQVNNYDASEDPDERGNVFTLPMRAVCTGAVFPINLVLGTATFDVVLYDGAGTALRSYSYSPYATFDIVGSVDRLRATWDPITLSAETTYRLALKATHASAYMLVVHATFPDTASREWFAEGARWQGTSRTDEGAWTDNPLSLFGNSLLLSQIEVVS